MTRSSHWIRIVAVLLFPPALGLVVGARRLLPRITVAAAQQIAEGPDHWVAFTADATMTDAGATRAVGRFYRGSDGSRRLESGPALDDVRVISIVNATEGQSYHYSSSTPNWTVAASEVTPGTYRPPMFRPSRPDISEYPYRLAIRRGESGALNASDGFRAYEMNAPDGTRKLTVPELNHFHILAEYPNGRTEAFTNIELVEPPTALFRPPEGSHIVIDQRPRR